MGIDPNKPPPLPAPTETETTTPTELATDISRPGDDKSTYSLPEDGTPVTIKTRGHRANKSQTSLLIEYFEGGKVSTSGSGTERKPSVRVRLTPSKKGKGDHFQVTETKGSRKVSLSRRIPVDHSNTHDLDVPEGEDAHSMTSYASATEESNVSRNPIDIEIERSHRRRRPASPLIPSEERIAYQPGNPSEISAIPTDSFLDGTGPAGDVKHSAYSHSKGDALAGAAIGALAGAAAQDVLHSSKTRSKDRSKASDRSKKDADKKRRSSKSRTSSVSELPNDEIRSPRRRSSRGQQDSYISGVESSMVSSNMSAASQRSLDARSVQSAASKSSSINNPKLLATVEDAIRRLILPELSALKREQSKREGRRSSFTSTGTAASREEVYTDRRRSSSHKPESGKDSSTRQRERRNREARHDYDDISMHSVSQDSIDGEYAIRDRDVNITSPKRSGDLLKAAAAGAAGLATAKIIATSMDERSESLDRKHRERRRRRAAESSRSRSLGRDKYADEFEEDEEPAPPMPLMSDINPSEMTRTSILSADSDRPHSAAEELLPISRAVPRGMVVTSGSTPSPSKLPLDAPPLLSTQHANVSQGDLTALPRGQRDYVQEYDMDEFGRKVPMAQDEYYNEDMSREGPNYAGYQEDAYDNSYYSVQDVPPPLKYVPYQAGARGLSPIPSVSGYTEGGSEAPLPHQSRSMHDVLSSPEKSPARMRQSRSIHSIDSIQLTPDMHRGSTFSDTHEHDGGQEVRGLSANPNIVHQPFGVESAVASLVDGSMLDQSVMTGASGPDYQGGVRDSFISAEDAARQQSRSRDVSPAKMSSNSRQDFVEESARGTPEARSLAQSHEFSEYELDDNGRKVPRSRYRHSPTASEAAITAGAVGAAAAALKAAKERQQSGLDEEAFQPAGVARNRSFKERAMGWQPKGVPTHTLDRFDDDGDVEMTANGGPDFHNPHPDFGYNDDDLITNPSIVQDRLDGTTDDVNWRNLSHSGRATPTPRAPVQNEYEVGDDKDGLGITEAIGGAAALGAAAAGMAAMTDHHQQYDELDQKDEWRRTSEERKRDTLITNPYEDASPVANPALHDTLLEARGLDVGYEAPYNTGSPGFVHKYDEGYMSNGPPLTPDAVPRGKSVEFDHNLGIEDPFYAPKENNPRHLSGFSQGMASPFYDASTGAGIERIENKDIVALMQHLMVRDAQRSARDTEIVALLMNAALEMRTSFREMKELVQDTGDDMIFANVENTEKLQKAINGPRPFAPGATRSPLSGSQAGTLEEVAKKKNLWRRALQGLSSKGTNDLTRIEDMLFQLLGEVNDLKTQNLQGVSTGGQGQSIDKLLVEDQQEQDKGYELENQSTMSYANQSAGHVSTRGGAAAASSRKFSDHRISTVPENEEEYEYDEPEEQLTPRQSKKELFSPDYVDEIIQRGESVPLEMPSQAPPSSSQPAAASADNTPKSERGKKHKSSSSSGWFPKISRWSETTASSVGRAFRGSGTSKKGGKYDDYQPPSRSGSSLASYDEHYNQNDTYDEDKLHTGFSEQNLATTEQAPRESGGPPPATQSFAPSEDPKYKAHRNSVNLQHPQPRAGQTERYRTALEYSAQEYDSPQTPRSTDWAGSATSLSRLPPNTNRYSTTSSAAVRDTEYAYGSSQQAPPRPPKEPMDSPSVHTPQKTSRVSQLQKDNSPMAHTSYESGYGSGTGTQVSHYTERSPKFENRNLTTARGVPSRRPSGPRAMTPKSPEEEAAREERRRKRDTFGTVASQDTETF